MTASAEALLRDPGGSQRVTLLELFFDLVFVGALAVTSTTLSTRPSWLGVVHTIIPLIAIWWVWTITAIVTDFYDPSTTPIQIQLGIVMVGTVLMTVSVPGAFDGHGRLFAASYVAVHVLRGVLLVSVLRGHTAQRRAARFMFWFGVSGVGWLVGAFSGDTVQAILWTVALVVDLVAGGFRYPTPWLGRVPLDQYARAREHIGERYQQFMILALGDLILVATLGYSRQPFSGAGTSAILVTFATTLMLWQSYVYRAGSLLLTSVIRRPGRAVRWAPYTHMTMVVGTVFTAAGADQVVSDPMGHTGAGGRAFIIGGPVLFLIGRQLFEYQVYGRIARYRLLFPVVLLALAPALGSMPSVAAASIVTAVLLALAVFDVMRNRRHRPPAIVRLVGQGD